MYKDYYIMIKFLRKRIKKENWRELSKDKIITKVLEYREEYEAVIVYKNDDYYGYIDLNQNPPIIMLPEYEPGFKPLELTFDDEIFEKAYDLFEQCTHLNMIPLNLELSADDIMIFACNICSVVNCKDLTSLAACVHNDRVKSFFAEKLQKNIKLVVLSELNEFTYKFYKVLKEIGVSTRTEGYLWTLIGINDNNTGVVSENKICYATPELVRHIGHFIYQKECVSEVEALRKKGINAYTLVIPYREDLNEFSLLEDIMFKPEGALSLIAKKKHKTKLDKYVLSKCLGDNVKNIIEAKEEYIYPDILGDEEATIYLVGPCIVSGEAGLESFSLARILKGLIEDKSLAYKIKRVGINRNNPAVVSIVEELDITDKDIVFLFREHWEAYLEKYDSCIDLAPVYHQRTTEQLFFTNIPIHTLRAGNEAIANYMLPYIIENASKSRTGQYLQLGVPFLTIREKKRLMNYIETVKIPCEINKHDTVGAIVMNGNPFTYGHMYLIEEAAKIVTYLYVMVVEEDLSEFKYVDRIRMIREGVRHIPNVSVVPSGSFVLSRHTFRAYFEKEEMQELPV